MEVYQKRIRELREDHDLSQEQVAEFLKIRQNVYSRYETGKNDIKIDKLVQLCLYYNVSADYVLGLPKGMNWPR